VSTAKRGAERWAKNCWGPSCKSCRAGSSRCHRPPARTSSASGGSSPKRWSSNLARELLGKGPWEWEAEGRDRERRRRSRRTARGWGRTRRSGPAETPGCKTLGCSLARSRELAMHNWVLRASSEKICWKTFLAKYSRHSEWMGKKRLVNYACERKHSLDLPLIHLSFLTNKQLGWYLFVSP